MASAAYLAGLDHLEARRFKQAADQFWKAVEEDEADFRAHLRYQEASRGQKIPLADLRADYDSLLEDHPKDLAFVLHRMRLDDSDGRLKALEELRRKHRAESDLVDDEIAYLHLELGETPQAIRALKGPARSGDRWGVALLVRALGSAGKTKEALKTAEPHLEDVEVLAEATRAALLGEAWEEALKLGEELRTRRPNSPRAALMTAEALERTGKRKEALVRLGEARRATEDAIPVLLAVAGLVQRSQDAKDLDDAGSLYGVVLKAEPENTRAIYGLAWVLEQQEKFEEAEKLYRKAATLLPQDPSPLESIGYVLYLQEKMSEAEAQFRRAIDIDPKYASAYANLAATYDARAEYSKAIHWYEKLLRMPGEEKNVRALVNCAFDYEQLGNFKKAESYLRDALKERPKDADLYVWLGDNLYFQEKWREAARVYVDALEIDDKSFYAWRGLGMAQARQRNWNDAVDALEKARTLDAEDTEVRLALGSIYYQQMRNKEKALECFEEYVQLGGEDPNVPAVIETIKEELAR